MFEVPLSSEAIALLRELAGKVGTTPEEFARRAILDRMEDTEDYFVAEERLRTSDGTSVSLEEVMAKYHEVAVR
jgi:RHH-type rel operon transcriptional repressor/antitoxin RelB